MIVEVNFMNCQDDTSQLNVEIQRNDSFFDDGPITRDLCFKCRCGLIIVELAPQTMQCRSYNCDAEDHPSKPQLHKKYPVNNNSKTMQYKCNSRCHLLTTALTEHRVQPFNFPTSKSPIFQTKPPSRRARRQQQRQVRVWDWWRKCLMQQNWWKLSAGFSARRWGGRLRWLL